MRGVPSVPHFAPTTCFFLIPRPLMTPPAAGRGQKWAAASFCTPSGGGAALSAGQRVVYFCGCLFCRIRAKENHTTALLCLRSLKSRIIPFNRFPLKGSLSENPTLCYFFNQKTPPSFFPQKAVCLKNNDFFPLMLSFNLIYLVNFQQRRTFTSKCCIPPVARLSSLS